MAGETATAVATITAGFVTGITVTSGGSGYTSEPAVTLSGGGGSGATAKAILSGDKVAVVVVLTAGSGYLTAPTVAVDSPPKPLSVKLEMVPKLTVEGPAGSYARVESAASLNGPWTMWTNLTVGAEGTVLVDLSPGSAARFYRAVDDKVWLIPAGMAPIPAGPFQMGDDRINFAPVHTVTVSAFAMDKWEVSIELWESVRAWGNSHGYDLVAGGSFGAKHPVHSVSWFDVVKWCNARSEKEGKVPAYYVDAAMTQVYRSDDKVPAGVKWDAGYRLPTEAESVKAARGGVAGKLYPWGTDEISAELANYTASNKGGTTPVGSYGANGYGLYDMAGNIREWTWDWYNYSQVAQTDPRGPSSGSERVIRGGCWDYGAENCQVANRHYDAPYRRYFYNGFRSVLPPGQP
jgi:formylglycine-generating enzyme required for sulfatase activity